MTSAQVCPALGTAQLPYQTDILTTLSSSVGESRRIVSKKLSYWTRNWEAGAHFRLGV